MDFMKPLLASLAKIKDPTLFADERGYQGELKSRLDRELALGIQEDDFAAPQVREEYQKRAELHGITLRPDIIIHVPYERGVSPTRKHDNYMVILLKRAAGRTKALKNFQSLETICSVLEYPVGVSINVSRSDLWLPEFPTEIPSSFTLHEIAVSLVDGKPEIQIASRSPAKAT
jgi:hypothetical protein